MIGHTDIEITIMKEEVFMPSSLETGGTGHHTRLHMEALGWKGGGMGCEQELYLWFQWEGTGKVG